MKKEEYDIGFDDIPFPTTSLSFQKDVPPQEILSSNPPKRNLAQYDEDEEYEEEQGRDELQLTVVNEEDI